MVSKYNKRGPAYVGNMILHFWECDISSQLHTLTPITSYESLTTRIWCYNSVSRLQKHQGTEVTNTWTSGPTWTCITQTVEQCRTSLKSKTYWFSPSRLSCEGKDLELTLIARVTEAWLNSFKDSCGEAFRWRWLLNRGDAPESTYYIG